LYRWVRSNCTYLTFLWSLVKTSSVWGKLLSLFWSFSIFYASIVLQCKLANLFLYKWCFILKRIKHYTGRITRMHTTSKIQAYQKIKKNMKVAVQVNISKNCMGAYGDRGVVRRLRFHPCCIKLSIANCVDTSINRLRFSTPYREDHEWSIAMHHYITWRTEEFLTIKEIVISA
jgi:hypothetical protein